MTWILVLHKYKPEVQKKRRRHEVPFNRRLNSPLRGLVAGALTASPREVLSKSSPSMTPTLYLMIPVCVPLGALWIPAGFRGWAWSILLSLQAACAWPTFRLLCALMAEQSGSTWGKSCDGFIRLISPQRQMGSFTGAWEVKSIQRHEMCLEGMYKAAFGNASCATLQQRYLCITWLCVTLGDVHNKQKGSETHRSFPFTKSCFFSQWDSDTVNTVTMRCSR